MTISLVDQQHSFVVASRPVGHQVGNILQAAQEMLDSFSAPKTEGAVTLNLEIPDPETDTLVGGSGRNDANQLTAEDHGLQPAEL